MYMANKVFVSVLCLVVVIQSIACVDNIEEISEHYLNGTWYNGKPEEIQCPLVSVQFGWGEGKTLPNGATEFDLIKKSMYCDMGLAGSPILSVTQIAKNTYEVEGAKYGYNMEKFSYFYIVQFITKDKIRVTFRTEWKKIFDPDIQAMDKIYYRLSGPGSAVEK